MTDPTLYLVASGASPVEPLHDLVRLLADDGWKLTVVSTPVGTRFHDTGEIERIIGEPVRVDFRHPGTGQRLYRPTVMLACPWSFTSTNKTVAGIADNFAVALLCEWIGARVPTVVVPSCNPPLADHPAFGQSVAALRTMPQVTVLHDPPAKSPTWAEVAAAVKGAAGAPGTANSPPVV